MTIKELILQEFGEQPLEENHSIKINRKFCEISEEFYHCLNEKQKKLFSTYESLCYEMQYDEKIKLVEYVLKLFEIL